MRVFKTSIPKPIFNHVVNKISTSEYVAIKVGTADADRAAAAVTGSRAADEASMVPAAIDQFSIAGLNGTHPCLVTFPANCSLSDSREASRRFLFHLDVVRSLCAQLTMTVCFIHSEGYAYEHLYLGILLPQLPSSPNNLSVKQMYAKFGAPKREPIVSTDEKLTPVSGILSYAVPPAWLGMASDEVALSEAKLLLSDFDLALRPSDKFCLKPQTPLRMPAPEAFFELTTPLSFPSDIWSIGCVIFELLGHRSLIDESLASSDEITAQQAQLQGPMLPEWCNHWEERSKWFDDVGRPLGDECIVWSWDRWFEELREEEKAALLDLLRWMLAWKPKERPSA
ncbi:kinase-like domain-containing protein [Xylaria sp. FL1042]|nr:kinase-like domain-containing protein [Xylaria sp. FL1042]